MLKRVILIMGVAGAMFANAAAIVVPTPAGVVDTRLIRSADAATSAVVDTRLPIVQLSNSGTVRTTALGLLINIR